MKHPKFGLGSRVVDEEGTIWVNRRDYLRLLDVCTGELGVRYLDSAQSYNKSEEAIGQWLQEKPNGFRERLIIGSKVSRKPMDREAVKRAGQESLAKLKCGTIDIYWTHSHDAATPVVDTFRGLNDLADAGVISEIGICNVTSQQILEILSACRADGVRPPAYVQNEFNLLNFRTEEQTTALCVREGLKYVAFSPLAGGILTGKYEFGGPLPAGSRWAAWKETHGLPAYWNAATFRSMARLETKAAELGVSMAGLALAWCGHRADVWTTILGPRHVGHLDALRDALRTTLTEARLREITDLFA